MLFEPKWFQVFPGTDCQPADLPRPGPEGQFASAVRRQRGPGQLERRCHRGRQQKYNFALKYNGFLAKHSNDAAGVGGNSNSSLGKYWDRDWVSFTFKTTF